MLSDHFQLGQKNDITILRLISADGTNRLSRVCVTELTATIEQLSHHPRPLIITGNERFFSVGADLNEIAALGFDAFEFARMGQRLMQLIDDFPAPVCAAIYGYCMGGGLDLALACDYRIAHPHAVFGHRGAALGLITGWGGTQRLPRLIGKARALELFVVAEKLGADRAFEVRLVDAVSENPVECVSAQVSKSPQQRLCASERD